MVLCCFIIQYSLFSLEVCPHTSRRILDAVLSTQSLPKYSNAAVLKTTFTAPSHDRITEQAEEKDKKRKLEEARNNEIARKHAVHETKRKAVKLSFLDDEDDDEGNSQAEDDWGDAVKAKLSRVVKNDEVDTSMFFPFESTGL